MNKSNYFWNSGIFFSNNSKIIKSIGENAPDIFKAVFTAWENKKVLTRNILILSKHLKNVRSESIDYAVLEKEKSIGLITLRNEWHDIGTWDAVSKISEVYDFRKNRE